MSERTQYEWGFEEILYRNNNFTVKLLHIDFGGEISLHKHLTKREMIIDRGLNNYLIEPGEKHTLHCDGDNSFVEFVEVSQNESDFDFIKVPDEN